MDDFEARLRAFRPRRPAAIPDVRLQRLRGPIWVAVAAGMAAAVLIAAWMRTPATSQRKPTGRMTSIMLGGLTTMAVESPEEFDAALTRISRSSLPDVTQPDGALRQLAREF